LVEQQLPPVAQAWPMALQPLPPTIALQKFALQLRVQHSAPVAQPASTSLHCALEHTPPTQRLLQHSVGMLQVAVAPLQKLP
jgi:hypothetical protein